jgi:NAD(P)-dependent dehydrogenase (short-subunit alcohol dehydrogenase family)
MNQTTETADRAQTGLFDLTGKRAIVTGASRGIGRAIAIGYAERGAEVVAVSRSQEGLDETVAATADAPGTCTAYSTDLRDPASIDQVVETAIQTLGGVDILVNNAGDDHDSPIEETSLDTFDRVVDLNLRSCWLLAKALSPHLTDETGGKVINIASVLGLVGIRDDSAYIASKHGVIGLTRGLALEWARKGVQVNAICPGFIRTEMTKNVFENETILKWVKRNTPMGRTAETEELVGPAVFLASSASDFMTGQVLVIDGGWTAQ